MKAEAAQSCKHFRKCTGCTRLNEPYAKQLAWKKQLVENRLASVLKNAKLLPVAPSPSPMEYRSSVKLCLHEDSLGRQSIGLYKTGTKLVIVIPRCPQHAPGINKLVGRLFNLPSKVPAPFYNHKGRSFQRGRLKYLTIRKGGDSEHAIIVSHTGVPVEDLRKWLAAVGLGKLCAYHSTLTKADDDQIIGRRVEHLSGPETFTMTLGERAYQMAPTAFFQANYKLAPALIEAATSFRLEGSDKGEVLLDLYGGFGAYSFPLADKFKRVFVVDGNDAAIDAANRTAAETGAKHVEASATTCEKFLASLSPDILKRVTHIIVNPPRNGLSERVRKFFDKKALPRLREVRYVSCNPETLARDLAVMTGPGGLRLKQVQPFDMFPQTDHVECVASLEA